jgi:hypothetical protein
MNVKISTPERNVVFNVTGKNREEIKKIEEFLNTKRHLFVRTGIVCEESSGSYKMNIYCPETTLEGVTILLSDFIGKNY